jgi:hypothetical protein
MMGPLRIGIDEKAMKTGGAIPAAKVGTSPANACDEYDRG